MICKVCGGKTDILHDGVCFDCAFAGKSTPISAQWINASPTPTEAVEQERLYKWAEENSIRWPELTSMYHIPNEGKRSRVTGGRLKRQGLKKGVPDNCLPVARCGCHALYIELKRMEDGRPTKEQLDWIDRLTKQGNMAMVCEGWEQAAEVIELYMEGRL